MTEAIESELFNEVDEKLRVLLTIIQNLKIDLALRNKKMARGHWSRARELSLDVCEMIDELRKVVEEAKK
ncbi:hypothetical protein HS7_20780 [Sulfolobales archaeon HS-7]|nr:hypothetical protein HS7_20780 [Sulfolobales archaeon HS-7]